MGNQMTAPLFSEDFQEDRIILTEDFTNYHLTSKTAPAVESYKKQKYLNIFNIIIKFI